MPVANHFDEIAETFDERVRRIVWCTVTTVDTRGRPFSRILHPVWEGATGWIATGRKTLKAKHLAGNPMVALSYWDAQMELRSRTVMVIVTALVGLTCSPSCDL
jgi:pyridoxine/pyridoxamine 5'-phosphate oxidase